MFVRNLLHALLFPHVFICLFVPHLMNPYNFRSWMTLCFLEAPQSDPDIDDVPSSTGFPALYPSSTLGLSQSYPRAPVSNNSNPITSTVPLVSPSSIPSTYFCPPFGLSLPNSTPGLSVPPPPGFPLQVNDVLYFPVWVTLTRTVPSTNNINDLALYQAANMNFNNLQYLPLSTSKSSSLSLPELPSEKKK